MDALQEAIENDEKIPDLILSDIQMPELDGVSLCKRIAKLPYKGARPSFVVITGKHTDEYIAPFEDYKDFFRDSIAKPFVKKDLRSIVNMALKNHFSK